MVRARTVRGARVRGARVRGAWACPTKPKAKSDARVRVVRLMVRRSSSAGLEHASHKRGVGGSSPPSGTSLRSPAASYGWRAAESVSEDTAGEPPESDSAKADRD